MKGIEATPKTSGIALKKLVISFGDKKELVFPGPRVKPQIQYCDKEKVVLDNRNIF